MRVPALVPRLRPFTSTIFAEMTALAVRTDSINLGQGFPDTDGPAGMLDAAKNALYGGANQYPPGPGRPELRAAIARHRERYGLSYDPDTEILVTAGATEAITAAVLALTEPGDEVIVVEPYYDSYPAAVAMAGATRKVVSLVEGEDGRFLLDVHALRAAVTPATRAILVNSPHNPTGTVFSDAELSAIAELCVKNDLVAITDEVYEHLVFDAAEHRPLATFPGMRERTVSISSAGKTFNCTGWKIGWVCATPDLVSAVKAAKQFITFVSGGPLQPAVAHALDHELSWVDELRKSLEGKRDRLSTGLAEAGFGVHPSFGTYFVCADVRPLGFEDATELAWQLPERIGVAAVPVSGFTDHPDEWKHLLRFAFCKRDEVLDEGIKRLHTLR
ncbi:N-succinyldiaminopimelate aminotransferase [Amycolatopsis bartoniae]|uniref:Aminotransferase n=1 Tax=Amycolatopsis bartoniae TaxID=941986 RepID=A0A8H9J3R6_9PSEU|nr:pyridoxal phosphate-dependent aminotransferase [Amycolatopsis bartoniae]MBB2933591.1 N-succinyldiaminopimelate aminotransferase [Amycolatopsis bartoniae]TVT10769.1 pyridoxal phosphate-dependent aminotransferase [Amycolatopsis bartoniae]GHF73061.1 aminotransferase [Amycolatopsis bartoniae]